MYPILYSYNKVSWQKKNGIRKIIRKTHLLYYTAFIRKNPCVSGCAQLKPVCSQLSETLKCTHIWRNFLHFLLCFVWNSFTSMVHKAGAKLLWDFMALGHIRWCKECSFAFMSFMYLINHKTSHGKLGTYELHRKGSSANNGKWFPHKGIKARFPGG